MVAEARNLWYVLLSHTIRQIDPAMVHNTELPNLKLFGRFCITQMRALRSFNYFLPKPCRVWLFNILLGLEKHLNSHAIYHTNNFGVQFKW